MNPTIAVAIDIAKSVVGNTGTRYSFRAECSTLPAAAALEISIVSPYFAGPLRTTLGRCSLT